MSSFCEQIGRVSINDGQWVTVTLRQVDQGEDKPEKVFIQIDIEGAEGLKALHDGIDIPLEKMKAVAAVCQLAEERAREVLPRRTGEVADASR